MWEKRSCAEQHSVEKSKGGGRGERKRGLTTVTFFFSFVLLNDMHLFKVQRQHPPSPLHTRQLKSQYHEIITTFPNSTPRPEFALGRGVHLPLSSPALMFIPLGLLHSGLMDFIFFDDVPSSYPAFALPRLEHLHRRQHSSEHLCYRRPGTRFAVRQNISTGHGPFLYSLSL